MIKSKIVETLGTFSQNEFKTFGKFVNSPYFNSSKSAVKFYNYLRKFYPDFENEKITPENAIQLYFPGKEIQRRNS